MLFNGPVIPLEQWSNITLLLRRTCRSNCTCRKKNHFLFRRSTSTSPEQHKRYWMYCWEKQIEYYWNVEEDRELSDACTRFILLNGRPPDGWTWSRRRLTRKQTTLRPDNVWPDMWKHISDAAKSKAKQKWAIETPKLDNARRLRGIFLIEPNDEEFKLTMKTTRRKLEVPMPPAMLCKIPIKSSGESTAKLGNV